MKKESALYKLCKNLNTKEKTYLKKFIYQKDANNQKRIQKVLEEYDRLKSYNLEDEKKIFSQIYNAKNVAASRQYVFKKIIDSLADYYTESDEELKLLNKIRQLLVLKKKQLTKEALQQVEKLSEGVEEGSIAKFRYYILSSHYNLLTNNMESNEKTVQRLSNLIANEGRIIYENGIASDLFNTCIQLRKNIPLYCHTPEHYSQVETLLEHPLLKEDELHSTFAKFVSIRSKGQLLMLKGELLAIRDIYIPHLDRAILETTANKLNFGTDAYSFLLILFWLREPVLFQKIFDQYVLLIDEMEDCYQKEVLLVYFLTCRIFWYKLMKQSDQKILEKWMFEMEQCDTELFADQYLHFFWIMSTIFFQRKEYDESLKILHTHIYAHKQLDDFKIYHFQARVQELLALYEMGLEENMKSRIRSFERLLVKEKDISLCFEVILKYFKMHLLDDFLDTKKHFSKLKVELQDMAKVSKTDQLLIDTMNLEAWLKEVLDEAGG